MRLSIWEKNDTSHSLNVFFIVKNTSKKGFFCVGMIPFKNSDF